MRGIKNKMVAMIGKIILGIFLTFAVCLLAYFFYLFILQTHRTFGKKPTIPAENNESAKGKYCPKCGTGNLNENKFCRGCGYGL